jgi:HK97 family phage prohead protease
MKNEMKKTLNASVLPSDTAGTFSGYLSTYNIDRDGDVFVKGCWDDYLDTLRKTKGVARVPLLYQHRADQIIGYVDLETDEKGLRANGVLYIESNEKANTIYKSLKDQALNEMSVGAGVIEYEKFEHEGKYGYKYIKLRVNEASIVFNPANLEAKITTVKNKKELSSGDLELVINSPLFEEKVVDILVKKGLLNNMPTTENEPNTVEVDKNTEQEKNKQEIKKILNRIKENYEFFK